MFEFHRSASRTLAAALLFVLSVCASADDPPAGWRLVWSDEFDGDRIDPEKWDFDLGNGFYSPAADQWIPGWGNDELQQYTNDPRNVAVERGELLIRAIRESRDGFGYTSARLKTRGSDGRDLFSTTYGRIEFRAKLPVGRGLWPALWMLPRDDSYGGWAASGEIDVMEARGQEPNKVLGTIHYGGTWPSNTHASTDYVFPDGGTVADYHVYAVEWEPGQIRWLVDGCAYATRSFWWSGLEKNPGGTKPTRAEDLHPWPAPFDRPFYLVINLAVGGRFLGNPDDSTPFPAEMAVDYVRVYEKSGGYGETNPRGEGKLPFDEP